MKILHVTDLHLCQQEDNYLNGVLTNQQFKVIFDLIVEFESPDMIILTGDIAHDEVLTVYQHLGECLSISPCPIYWVQGNHDNAEMMSQAFAYYPIIKNDKLIAADDWQLILLNSQQPGEVAGYLHEDELQKLTQAMQSNKPSMIFLHHHVLPIDSIRMDMTRLQNYEELLTIIEQHDQVKAVFSGHVHWEGETTHNNTVFYTTPSTCYQFIFKPDLARSQDYLPGYRKIVLHENGQFTTEVKRYPLDFIDVSDA